MKKLLFAIFSLFLALPITNAQTDNLKTLIKTVKPKAEKLIRIPRNEDDKPLSTIQAEPSMIRTEGTELQQTYYDWQSNDGARTWTHVWNNGKVDFAFDTPPTPPTPPTPSEIYDFENSTLQGWTTIDGGTPAGYGWQLVSNKLGTGYGHNGSVDAVMSQSYDNNYGVIYPDNYLISPQVTLGGSITFYACAQDANYAAEHFGVAVSTSGASASDFTMLQEWTIGSKGERYEGPRGTRDQSPWIAYTVDLSAYAGQTGYVAIRHFNCSDQFYLLVDDITLSGCDVTISVSASPSSGGSVSGGGTYNYGQSCTVTATANISYAFTNWTEGGSQVSTNANYTFTVTGNRTLVANFTLQASMPTVTTTQVTNITQTTATGGGNVTADGGASVTARGVCWSMSHNPTVSGNHTTNGTGTGSFTSSITGLTANTTYYVRAYATNSVGTSYGSEVSFTTAQNITAPTVTTSEVTSITQTTATGGGNVTADGGASVTARGVCWSTSHNPTISGSHAYNGTGTGSFTINMTGLTANTHYYVRAYAWNSAGVSYGNEVDFTTAQNVSAPTVTTSQVTNITQTTATGGGNVTADGGASVTARGVCWSTSHNPTVSGNHTTNSTGTGSFTSSITGLTANTTYYVRAYATNSVGTSYGSEVSFTTAQNITAPTVTTSEVTSITQTTATGGGNVTADGGASVTARGVCWSMSHNPITSGSHANSGTGTGSFTVNMTGLTANTTYYVRAYAINSAGTSYGSEVSFTTAQIPTYTISVSANPTYGGTVTGGGTYQQGQTCTVHATANDGYTFNNWKEGGTVVSSNTSHTFQVSGSASFEAHFQAITHTVALNADPADGGSVTGGGSYPYGNMCTVNATPAEGFFFVRWSENGTEVTPEALYQFTVTQDRTLTAVFRRNGHTIYASSGANGTINPSGDVIVQEGDDQTFTMVPNDGYKVSEVYVDGAFVGSLGTFTFSNVTEDHSIYVSFAPNIGVEENNDSHIVVHPNPTNGIANVHCNDAKEIRVYNILGVLVKTIEATGEDTQIDLGKCKSGLYILNIIQDSDVINMRIVKR